MASQVRKTNTIYNLRSRWPDKLRHLSDDKLFAIYEDFASSDYYGRNDEHFLQFLKDIELN